MTIDFCCDSCWLNILHTTLSLGMHAYLFAGDTEQLQDEHQGSQPCSDPSAARQQATAKPFVSPLLASLSKARSPPVKMVIPAAVLAAQGAEAALR